MNSRRAFLKTISGAALAASAPRPLLSWAVDDPTPKVIGKDSLILRSYRFLDLETPVEILQHLADASGAFLRTKSHARTQRA